MATFGRSLVATNNIRYNGLLTGMAEQQVVGRIRGMECQRTTCHLVGQVLENDEFVYRGVWFLTVSDA